MREGKKYTDLMGGRPEIMSRFGREGYPKIREDFWRGEREETLQKNYYRQSIIRNIFTSCKFKHHAQASLELWKTFVEYFIYLVLCICSTCVVCN